MQHKYPISWSHIFWSPTRLRVIQSCFKKYYFEYIKKEKVPIPSYFALGTFLHDRMKILYDGEFGDLKATYKSAMGFAKASAGWWKKMLRVLEKFKGEK